MSDSQDVLIHTKFTSSISGYWGLGFIASPSRRTDRVIGTTGKGCSVFMNDFNTTTRTFSGKGYKPMGDMLDSAMWQNQSSNNEEAAMQQAIKEEKDSKLKVLKQGELAMFITNKAKLEQDADQFTLCKRHPS